MRAIIIGFIRAYQLIVSPWLPTACRFNPTCSEYAILAIRKFGVVKGSRLVVGRLLRCRPFGKHGYDPVPNRET